MWKALIQDRHATETLKNAEKEDEKHFPIAANIWRMEKITRKIGKFWFFFYSSQKEQFESKWIFESCAKLRRKNLKKRNHLKKHFTTLSYYIEWFSDSIMGNVFSRINKFADHIENIVSINCIGLNRSKDMKRTVTSIHTSRRAHNCTHTHILMSFCSLPPANGVSKFLICTIFLFNFFFIFFYLLTNLKWIRILKIHLTFENFPNQHERTKQNKNTKKIELAHKNKDKYIRAKSFDRADYGQQEWKIKKKTQRSFQNHYKNKHRHRWRNMGESIWEWTL